MYIIICSPLTNPIGSILCNTGVDVLSGSVLFTSTISKILLISYIIILCYIDSYICDIFKYVYAYN